MGLCSRYIAILHILLVQIHHSYKNFQTKKSCADQVLSIVYTVLCEIEFSLYCSNGKIDRTKDLDKGVEQSYSSYTQSSQ